jgi:hypothetical protein
MRKTFFFEKKAGVFFFQNSGPPMSLRKRLEKYDSLEDRISVVIGVRFFFFLAFLDLTFFSHRFCRTFSRRVAGARSHPTMCTSF